MAVVNLTGRPIPMQVGEHRVMFPEYVNADGQTVVLQIQTELYECDDIIFAFKSSEDEEGEMSEAQIPILVGRSQVSLPAVGDNDIIIVNENHLPSCRNMARVVAPHEGSAILDNAGELLCYTRFVSA